MSYTWHQTYECGECGYVFNGLNGFQDHGEGIMHEHHIQPKICKKCGSVKNVVSTLDTGDLSVCDNCGIKMESMDKDVIYECPQCHNKSLKCVNTESVYQSKTIYIY